MKYHLIHLTGTLTETAPAAVSTFALVGRPKAVALDRLFVQAESLVAKPAAAIVVVHWDLDFEPGIYGNLEALRAVIARLVAAGKQVWFFAKEFQAQQLYIASACTTRILHPLGATAFLGLARRLAFYKRLLDRYEIGAEVIRVGRYKSAGDAFRLDHLDEHNKVQIDAVMDAVLQEWREKIGQGYRKGYGDIEALQDGVVLSAQQSLAAGWADRLATLDDILAEFKTAKTRELRLKTKKLSFGSGAKIAVLQFEGAIKDGESAQHPLLGAMTGSAKFIPVIRKLAHDTSVKAVVFRINSGGGSATASEDIARELGRLQAKKPVVVSMGGVAGSGGYWIAVEAGRIVAQRTTITGSIGVITIQFYVQKLLERYGITDTTLRRGEFADLGSPYRPLTDADRTLIRDRVQTLYGDFLAKVAKPRRLTTNQVHELAEGHIYCGQTAVEIGLVDEVGSLYQAIKYAKNQANLRKARVFFTPRPKRSLVARLIGLGALVCGQGVGDWLAAATAGGLGAGGLRAAGADGFGASPFGAVDLAAVGAVVRSSDQLRQLIEPLHGRPLAVTDCLYL